jgi:hypothetical protein
LTHHHFVAASLRYAVGLADLREFLAKLKGRRPQEVIGIVSASLLFKSMMQASMVVVAILVIFTVGPYLIYGPPQPKQSAPRPTERAEPAGSDQAAQSSPLAEQPSQETNASAEPPNNLLPNAEKATEVMGLDESKAADPKTNPLDSPSLDNLLDGLDP